MGEDFSEKLIKGAKGACVGFLGATAIIHFTVIFLPIFRDFENRYFSERHPEFETALLLIAGFLTLIMEPVFYIVNLAVSLEKYGLIAFLWLAPLAISHCFAFITWILKKKY